MFKPFYVHVNLNQPGQLSGRVYRAATVLVSPSDDAQKCKIQVALCSKKDEFVKKLGREYATQAPVQEINKRQLPQTMADIAKATGKPWCSSFHYNYLLRNFV